MVGRVYYHPKPIERIESLCLPLRFRVPLGSDGNGKVRFERPRSRLLVREHQG